MSENRTKRLLRGSPGNLARAARIKHNQIWNIHVVDDTLQTLGKTVVQQAQIPITQRPRTVQNKQLSHPLRNLTIDGLQNIRKRQPSSAIERWRTRQQ